MNRSTTVQCTGKPSAGMCNQISSRDNVLHTEVVSPTHWSQLRLPILRVNKGCKAVTCLQTCVLTDQSLRLGNRRTVMGNASFLLQIPVEHQISVEDVRQY